MTQSRPRSPAMPRQVLLLCAVVVLLLIGAGFFASHYPQDEHWSVGCAAAAVLALWIGIPALTRIGWTVLALPAPASVLVVTIGVACTPDAADAGKAIPVGSFMVLVLAAITVAAVRSRQQRDRVEWGRPSPGPVRPLSGSLPPPAWGQLPPFPPSALPPTGPIGTVAASGPLPSGPGGPLDGADGSEMDLDLPPVRFAPLDPFGAHFFVGFGRPIPGPTGNSVPLAKTEAPADPATNPEVRDAFVTTLKGRGGEDRAVAVAPAEFFAGNGDRSSIGPRSGRHPGLAAIRDRLLAVAAETGVQEVMVEVEPLRTAQFDGPRWPRAARARMVTSRALEDVLGLVGDTGCGLPWTDGSVTFADGRPAPDGSRAVGISWE